MMTAIEDVPAKVKPPVGWFRRVFGIAVAGPILGNRKVAIACSVLGIVQVVVATYHLPWWQCPVLATTGVPCPGCGLSQACSAGVSGHFGEMVHLHAFAPLFLLAIGFCTVSAVLPEGKRRAFAGVVSRFETATCFSTLSLVLLIVYWIVRLVYR